MESSKQAELPDEQAQDVSSFRTTFGLCNIYEPNSQPNARAVAVDANK